MKKIPNIISWDELFIGIAELASQRSKDPNTRHGVCIINPSLRVVSVGYNGLPYGIVDHNYYWSKEHKYEYVVHAEENALFNTSVDLKDCIMYLYSDKGYYPCSRCARGIVQNRIKEIVLKTAIEENTQIYDWTYSKDILKYGNVNIRVLE